MLRDICHPVVVKIVHAHPAVQQALQRLVVSAQGQVAHQHLVAPVSGQAVQQFNIALEPADQPVMRWVLQAPLHHGTQAVGVSMAYIDLHGPGSVAGAGRYSDSDREFIHYAGNSRCVPGSACGGGALRP